MCEYSVHVCARLGSSCLALILMEFHRDYGSYMYTKFGDYVDIM